MLDTSQPVTLVGMDGWITTRKEVPQMGKKTENMANITKVLPCTCGNHTQDRKYGEGNRLHYRCKEGWRCGTCKTVTPIPEKKPRKGGTAHDNAITRV